MESQRQQNTSAVEAQATVRAPAAATTWAPLKVGTPATAEMLAQLGNRNSMMISSICSEASNRRDANLSWDTSNNRDAFNSREPITAGTPAKQGRQQQQERQ